jgi:hypothetical protein
MQGGRMDGRVERRQTGGGGRVGGREAATQGGREGGRQERKEGGRNARREGGREGGGKVRRKSGRQELAEERGDMELGGSEAIMSCRCGGFRKQARKQASN